MLTRQNVLSVRMQLLSSCILFLIVILLIFWLLGGFPPPQWGLLLQTLGHLGQLGAARGNALVFPLILLIVQSLLQVLVWSLLVCAIILEVRSFKRLRAPQIMPVALLSNVASPPPVRSVIQQNSAASAGRSPLGPGNAANQLRVPLIIPAPSSSNVASPPPVRSVIQQNSAASVRPLRSNNAANAGLTPSAIPARPSVSPKVLNEPWHGINIPPTERLSDKALLPEGPLKNPFEVPEDADKSSEHGASLPDAQQQKSSTIDPYAVKKDDNPFIFGNPFEGPLPEIFQYDDELKRTVKEMTKELKDPKDSPGGKPGGQ